MDWVVAKVKGGMVCCTMSKVTALKFASSQTQAGVPCEVLSHKDYLWKEAQRYAARFGAK